MAKLETRQFGSKKFLLIVPDNEEEIKTIESVLGKKEVRTCNGEMIFSETLETYIRLQSGKQAAKE